MTPRQEVADRHEIQEHDREPQSRQVRRPPPSPADPPRRERLERIDRPGDDRDEDLRVLERHGLNVRVTRRGAAHLCGPDGADHQADGQEHPADDDRFLIHRIETQRRKRVEEAQVLGFDLLDNT